MQYIHKIIDSVVESLKLIGTTTNITNVSGNTYEFTTDATGLVAGEFVKLIGATTFNKDGYKITSKTDTSFRISTNESIVISTFGSWQQKKWFFEFGRFKEASEVVTLFSGKSKTFDPFPMVWLVSTFEESVEAFRFLSEIKNLRLVFINRTEYQSTIEKYDNNIETIIDPYFKSFMNALNDRIELWRPFYGIKYSFENMPPYSEDNKNKFTTITDAKVVDFSNISIMKENSCVT